ncbi:hypothetical protein ACFY19_04550 [Streptosporangium saharense]|uniref:hypothetical protein n=1 Tax=Streptosporangium saharense TaxID=1706840 RepID=UPI0036CA609F
MSFGGFARRVRDPALPHAWRVSALRSCVRLYRPIGFEATLSFLRAKAGPFRTDEAALLRALAVLEASRTAWQEEKRVYAQGRRRAKRRGERSPRPGEVNPYRPSHWYGARREAALHAVGFWYRRRPAVLVSGGDGLSTVLWECVLACLDSGGRLTPAQGQRLAGCVERLTALQAGYRDGGPAERVRDLLTVARHLEALAEVRVRP